MAVDRGRALLKIIDKIPMFTGLGEEKGKLILQLGEFRSAESGEVLCQVGEQSSEMLILLSGKLGVFNSEHVQLAEVEPAAPVGEMGLITGQARSATVRVLEDANLLVIKKTVFDRLMRSDGEICAQVYGNVIQTLARRLRESKQLQSVGEKECRELEEQLNALVDQIEALRGEE